MSDVEQRLAEALRRLRPAPRDPAFRVAVLQRRARQRFRARAGWLLTAGAGLTGLGIVAEPALTPLRLAGVSVFPIALLAGSAAVTGWCLSRMRRPV